MITYKKYWEAEDQDWHKFGVLRAKNLAEEIVVGWIDCTTLKDFDLQLTCQAMELYNGMIERGEAEQHYDDICRSLVHLHCEGMVDEMQRRDEYVMGWAETMLAARALKAFSEYLQGRIDELPPEQAQAA